MTDKEEVCVPLVCVRAEQVGRVHIDASDVCGAANLLSSAWRRLSCDNTAQTLYVYKYVYG